MLITSEDFANAGGQAGGFIRGLGGAILGTTCQLYQNFPRSFIGGLAGDSPVGNFNKGVWDSICGGMPDPTLPAPPSRPFEGGQCCSSSYEVTMTANVSSGFGGGTATGRASRNNARVLGGRLAADGSAAVVDFQDCAGNVFSQVAIQSAAGALISASVLSVVAYSGPDNCGSLPADYPNTPFVPGAGTYNYQPPQGGAPVPVNYNIDVLPNFRPVINFPDIPNLCASFNIYGVDVDLCSNVPPEGGGGDGNQDLLDKLQELEDAIKGDGGIGEKIDDLSKKGDGIVVEPGEGDNGTDEDVAGLLGIFVSITSIPVGLGREFGTPDRFDFGRISFKRDGFYSEPQKISFYSNYYVAPEGSTGYALSYAPGVGGTVQVLKRDEG